MANQLTPEQIALASRYFIETRDALTRATDGLSESQWTFKQNSDCWSIAEILEHIVIVEGRVHMVVESLAGGSDGPPPGDPAEMDAFILREIPQRTQKVQAPPQTCPTGSHSGPEYLPIFLEGRQRTIRLLTTPALRESCKPHPLFGLLDGYQWLLAAAAHGARHTNQIQEVKEGSGYPQLSVVSHGV